jgi:hypothetical protein
MKPNAPQWYLDYIRDLSEPYVDPIMRGSASGAAEHLKERERRFLEAFRKQHPYAGIDCEPFTP